MGKMRTGLSKVQSRGKEDMGEGGSLTRYLESIMKTKTNQNSGESQAAITRIQCIKLGLDVHADSFLMVRILDGQAPQPGQRISPAVFLDLVKKQLAQAEKVYVCYEAGPFGYSLQRQLTELGVVCYVVRPRNWDEYGSHVKTDKRDAHELALCLDRYVSGNTKAFCVVRVPTPEEEQRRSESRHRQSLLNQKKRLAAQGRGDALYYGHRLKGNWWKGAAWEGLAAKLPAHLVRRLSSLKGLIEAAEKELRSFTREIEASADQPLPAGVGRLTAQTLEREVCDWSRFKNRRQVASYTGLCPREDSSGPRRFQGSINKHGNRRLRPLLIECLWRLSLSQPNYRLVKKWQPLLLEAGASKARRKKIIVAMARQFAVDWWRIRTGRVTTRKLGLA
jgi:transposase